MEYQKILNLLNEASNSKFVTRKWNTVNDNSKANYDVGNEIIYNTEVLKSNLCDYNGTYILVRVTITAAPTTQVAFKNSAPFTKFITKVDGTTIHDAEDLDLVIPIYNLIEYSSNFSKKTGILWFYSKGEPTNFNADFANNNNFKYFKYKGKLLENTAAQAPPNEPNGILIKATFAVSLKYLSNFWRSLEMQFINCKVELKLKWTKYCFVCSW